MGKNAVVLGGGGAKGAYEIGVLTALSKLKFKYDIITGTSVGSINGAIAAQGDISLARKMWNEITTDSVLDIKSEIPENQTEAYRVMAKELMENSGFDYTNLKKLLEGIIDEKKLRESPIDLGLVTVRFPSMIPVHIFKEDIKEGEIVDYILASAACFPAMKPHKIGKELYIDGGYNDNIPVNMAIKKGATNIVAVDLNAIGKTKRIKEKNVNIIYVNSYTNLGNMLIFDKNRAKKNIRLGYLDTFKAFEKLDGYKYTFKKDELTKNFKRLYPVISGAMADYIKEDKIKFSKLIKQIAYRTYKPRFKGELNKELYLSLILESTMEFFSLPLYEVYRVKKAEFIIKNKFKKIKKDDISSIYELISKITENKNFIENAEKVKELLKGIDDTRIIKYIYDLFDSDFNSKRGIIMLLLMCVPAHFFSALYIKAITQEAS